MSDLIDRQKVVDALTGLIPFAIFDEATEAYSNWLTDAYNLICQLPSAEPEIIRCKDCKHYNAGFECLIEGYGIERDKNWYCGDAERRTDE